MIVSDATILNMITIVIGDFKDINYDMTYWQVWYHSLIQCNCVKNIFVLFVVKNNFKSVLLLKIKRFLFFKPWSNLSSGLYCKHITIVSDDCKWCHNFKHDYVFVIDESKDISYNVVINYDHSRVTPLYGASL
jgi:hypothetical protein